MECCVCNKGILFSTISNYFVCDDCLKKHFYKCSHCEDFVPKSVKDDNGNFVSNQIGRFSNHTSTCRKCFEKDFVYCTECNEIIGKDESFIQDDSVLCNECFHDTYFECDGCGRPHVMDDSNSVDGELYCSDCFYEQYSYCHGCDTVVHNDYSNWACDDSWCDTCFDAHFIYCEGCGESIERDRLNNVKCPECQETLIEVGQTQVLDPPVPNTQFVPNRINSYSYEPEYVFKSLSTDNVEPLYFGIEIETDNPGIESNQTLSNRVYSELDSLGVDKDYYFKNDSSVSGFEIITHPMSMGYIKEKIKIKKVLKKLKDLFLTSYKSGNCGMHIHINRSYLDDNEVRKLRFFFSEYRNELYTLSNRKGTGGEYCQFEHYSYRDYTECRDDDNGDRNKALNLNSGKPTIEFRMFRGTLKYNAFVFNIELVENIIKYIKTFSCEHLEGAWSGFEDFMTLSTGAKKYYDKLVS